MAKWIAWLLIGVMMCVPGLDTAIIDDIPEEEITYGFVMIDDEDLYFEFTGRVESYDDRVKSGEITDPLELDYASFCFKIHNRTDHPIKLDYNRYYIDDYRNFAFSQSEDHKEFLFKEIAPGRKDASVFRISTYTGSHDCIKEISKVEFCLIVTNLNDNSEKEYQIEFNPNDYHYYIQN